MSRPAGIDRDYQSRRTTSHRGCILWFEIRCEDRPNREHRNTFRANRSVREGTMSALADSIPITATTEATDRRRRIIAIVGASSGNLVEWYDFYAYAFTSIYFASAFF